MLAVQGPGRTPPDGVRGGAAPVVRTGGTCRSGWSRRRGPPRSAVQGLDHLDDEVGRVQLRNVEARGHVGVHVADVHAHDEGALLVQLPAVASRATTAPPSWRSDVLGGLVIHDSAERTLTTAPPLFAGEDRREGADQAERTDHVGLEARRGTRRSDSPAMTDPGSPIPALLMRTAMSR